MDDTRNMITKVGNRDNLGYITEDFGNPINLMIAESTTIVQGDFENCVKTMKKDYEEKLKRNR